MYWNYSICNIETGKIENGQIKYPFSASSLAKGFEDNGYEVLYLAKVNPLIEKVLNFIDKIEKGYYYG